MLLFTTLNSFIVLSKASFYRLELSSEPKEYALNLRAK